MPDNIRNWLSNLGFAEYSDAFVENRLALTDLSDLTEDDLRELGIAAMGDRKRLMRAIASLSNIKAASADVESTLSQEALSSAAERL